MGVWILPRKVKFEKTLIKDERFCDGDIKPKDFFFSNKAKLWYEIDIETKIIHQLIMKGEVSFF